MAKLFRNYTWSEFKSEKEHPENKICFIKDKSMLYANGIYYSHATQDTVTTGGTVEVLAPLLNLTTASQVTITGFDTSVLNIDRFTLVNINDINNLIQLGGSINKVGTLEQIELSKGDTITFVKNGSMYDIEIGLGSHVYIPSLIPSEGKNAISISSDGTITGIKYTEMKAWSDASSALNAETLNKNFPDAPIGFQVVCSNANRIYEKVNVTGDWIGTQTVSVALGGGAA